MTAGFAPAWLALREPLDLLARSRDVLEACAAAFENRRRLCIVDLGAGTGATLRAIHHLLPAEQDWILVDHDAENLAASRRLLCQQATLVAEDGETLELALSGKMLRVTFRFYDLARGLPADIWGADLVTASALFDLVSAEWIDSVAESLSARGVVLLAMLNFDGILEMQPEHPLDAAVAAAFARHQKSDKGLGIAAGPDAPAAIVRAFGACGYHCRQDVSPWRIDDNYSAFLAELVTGITTAVKDTGLLSPARLAEWQAFVLSGSGTLTIGHRDILALPPA